MIPFLSGLLYFLIFLFTWVGLVMLLVVITDTDNAISWLLGSPLAGIVGFVFGFLRSKAGQEEEQE